MHVSLIFKIIPTMLLNHWNKMENIFHDCFLSSENSLNTTTALKPLNSIGTSKLQTLMDSNSQGYEIKQDFIYIFI